MISEYSQTDMINISRMNRYQLAQWIRSIAAPYKENACVKTLDVIRQLQIALAEYGKKHKYDYVQDKMIVIIMKLEKWARLEFHRIQKNEVTKRFPEYANKPTILKRIVNNEWERLRKARSY